MVPERVTFVLVTRAIDPVSRIHYLDAIDNNGHHWMAEMSHQLEKWLVFTRDWYKDELLPLDNNPVDPSP